VGRRPRRAPDAHPALARHDPRGLILGVVYLVTEDLQFATLSFSMAVLAAVGGVAAAATGAVDFKSIPKGTRAKGVSLVRATGNDIVIGVFALTASLRYLADDYEPCALALALALTFAGAGAGISFVTGWLGGELAERLGVGVHSDAHLDGQQLTRGWSSYACRSPIRRKRRREPPAGGPGVGPALVRRGAGLLAFLGRPATQARLP
jgi:uncharacterized membrane protein